MLKLIITFLIGLVLGSVLTILIYAFIVLLTIKKRSYIIEAQNKDISKDDIKKLIDDTRNNYMSDYKSEDYEVREGALKRNITFLAERIAEFYFPDSKRPLAELTIDELIMLDKYIVKRIEEILDKPGLRIIKRFKLNTIIELSQTKKNIENSKVLKVVERYNLKQFFKDALRAINYINPVYWLKVLTNNVIAKLVYKINLVIISISGQELYKIYSKKAFEEENEQFDDEEFKQIETQLTQIEEEKKQEKISQ